MQTTNSVSEAGECSLVQVSNWPLEGVRFYVTPTVPRFREGVEVLSTGTREEMKALQKLMTAAHGKD